MMPKLMFREHVRDHRVCELAEDAHVVFRIVTQDGVKWIDKQLIPQLEDGTVTSIISVART